MEDQQDQLRDLRRRVARINLKYKSGAAAPAAPAPPPARSGAGTAPFFPPRPDHYHADEILHGDVVETPHGKHFETERIYEAHRRHGSMDIGSLCELPEDLLNEVSAGEVRPFAPPKWAFLDTETTGLAGGAGTYAFLIGVGRITPEGFRVRQFFMRDFAEESSLLWSLSRHLEEFDVLVTYNGKVYDQPLLETRYRMARSRDPFGRMDHLDLLYGARRLWRLQFQSCRLVDLEYQILGFERQGDVPGEMIPYLYFEFVRRREAFRLVPVFHHNAIDILTLACLTAIVPWAFRSPEDAPLTRGPEVLGLSRWVLQTGDVERGLALMRRAVDIGLPDDLLFRTLWDIAMQEKKRDCRAEAVTLLTDLAISPNPYRIRAMEELAKHYEHHERDYATALEMTLEAIGLEPCEALERRATRLRGRLTRPKSRSLLE